MNPLSPLPVARLAQAWGITPEQIPATVDYLMALILASQGDLEVVEVQLRPAGERYVFRSTDAAEDSKRIVVDRPLGWDAEQELAAAEDLLVALSLEQAPAPPSELLSPRDGEASPRGSSDKVETRGVMRLRSAQQTTNAAWTSVAMAQTQLGRSSALLRQLRQVAMQPV